MCLPAGEDFAAADSDHRKPTAIILEPSKDLAEQTHDFMVRFKHYLTQPQLRCELLIGGTNPKQASRALEEGVDIITGTPGDTHNHTHGLVRSFLSVGGTTALDRMATVKLIRHRGVRHSLSCLV